MLAMDRRDEIRVADSDRTAVAERLRTALNEGRLELHEYDERLQRTYAAKTYGDLEALLVDLPANVPTQRAELLPVAQWSVAVPEEQVHYPGAMRRWLIDTWGGYLIAVAITTAVWGAASLGDGEVLRYWPGWVTGPWGVVLAISTFAGLIDGTPQRWAAKRARRAQGYGGRF